MKLNLLKFETSYPNLNILLHDTLLHFLSFILPSVDKFNRAFQKSTEKTTSQMFDEMSRLVRLYAANFLTKESIIEAGDNLCRLRFDATSQVSNYQYLGLHI